MPIRGAITVECESPDCTAERIVQPAELLDEELTQLLWDEGWQTGKATICPECKAAQEAAEDAEQAASDADWDRRLDARLGK